MALFFVIAHLMRPKRRRPELPSQADLAKVREIVRQSPQSAANLTLLGDKELLLSPSDKAFLSFSRRQRAWVAMGEPVGLEDERAELAWNFRELSDRHGARTVFFGLDGEKLSLYLEMGLTAFTIGQEAWVELKNFTLDDSRRRELRETRSSLRGQGYTFEVIPAGQLDEPTLAQIESVNKDWLAHRGARGQSFSFGSFDAAYIRRLPLAVVRQQDRMQAFAVIWPGERQELAIDLPRHLSNAPKGIMDYLQTELILWGQRQEFRWFNVGLAPLACGEQDRSEPMWSQLASFVSGQGQPGYDFQALWQAKNKFAPHWRDKYVAAPDGWALADVLKEIADMLAAGLAAPASRTDKPGLGFGPTSC
jgi:phosphatidylglycerol lysyltransferase